MKQLIEDRYIGAKVGDSIGVVDRRGFIAPDGGGGGGEQPTLFAPVVTGGVNEISWANNPDNGAFGSVVGTIDDNVVTSPLTITQAMDGKTLVLTASEENFHDATETILLTYISASTFISYNVGSGGDDRFAAFTLYSFSSGDATCFKAEYEGNDYIPASSSTSRFGFPIKTGNNEILLKFKVVSPCTLTRIEVGAGTPLGLPAGWRDSSPYSATPVGSTWAITLMLNGATLATNTRSGPVYYIPVTFNQALAVGDELTFILNVA